MREAAMEGRNGVRDAHEPTTGDAHRIPSPDRRSQHTHRTPPPTHHENPVGICDSCGRCCSSTTSSSGDGVSSISGVGQVQRCPRHTGHVQAPQGWVPQHTGWVRPFQLMKKPHMTSIGHPLPANRLAPRLATYAVGQLPPCVSLGWARARSARGSDVCAHPPAACLSRKSVVSTGWLSHPGGAPISCRRTAGNSHLLLIRRDNHPITSTCNPPACAA